MGTLWYGHTPDAYTLDDRLLMHLQIVIVDKLRKNERFVFTCDESGASSRVALWMSPEISLRFSFLEPAGAKINPQWVAALAHSARSTEGLQVMDEPGVARHRRELVHTQVRGGSPVKV